MLDPYNLIRNGIILGQELLYLEFCTAGADKAGLQEDWKVSFTKKNPLYIHKVQDLKALAVGEGDSQSALTYRLHFCSPELIQNDRTRVSRTLQGTYSDMIKNILKNDLKTPKKFEKDKNFNEIFVQLAREVYFNNDRRAKIKLEINKIFKSNITEIKKYANY